MRLDDCNLVLCIRVWSSMNHSILVQYKNLKTCTVDSGVVCNVCYVRVCMINYLVGSFWFQIIACIYVDLSIFILLDVVDGADFTQLNTFWILCMFMFMFICFGFHAIYEMKITNFLIRSKHQCSMATYRSLSGWCTKSKPFNAYMKRGSNKPKKTYCNASANLHRNAESNEIVCIFIPSLTLSIFSFPYSATKG